MINGLISGRTSWRCHPEHRNNHVPSDTLEANPWVLVKSQSHSIKTHRRQLFHRLLAIHNASPIQILSGPSSLNSDLSAWKCGGQLQECWRIFPPNLKFLWTAILHLQATEPDDKDGWMDIRMDGEGGGGELDSVLWTVIHSLKQWFFLTCWTREPILFPDLSVQTVKFTTQNLIKQAVGGWPPGYAPALLPPSAPKRLAQPSRWQRGRIHSNGDLCSCLMR